jgi:FMN phosphatase YigB (HAD superfamily)
MPYVIVVSHEIGRQFRKPHPVPFLMALHALGVVAADAVDRHARDDAAHPAQPAQTAQLGAQAGLALVQHHQHHPPDDTAGERISPRFHYYPVLIYI